MSTSTGRALGCAALLCALLLPARIRAEDVYQWVDAQGNVHFSDTPTPGAAARPSKGVELSRPVRSQEARRSIGVERLQLDVSVYPIDKIVRGCGENQYAHIESDTIKEAVKQSELIAKVHARLAAEGYLIAADGSKPDLSLVGVIHKLQFPLCAGRLTTEIRWRVFDPRQGKLVHEASFAGNRLFELGFTPLSGMVDALAGVVLQSARSLVHSGEFMELLRPPDEAKPVAASEPGPPLELALRYGKAQASFASMLGTLRAGTVIVRALSGHGGGILLTDSGYVLTSEHLIANSPRIAVLVGSQTFGARVVRSRADRNVALLQIERSPGVSALALSRRVVREGESLYVMGSPIDESLRDTVTSGILSAKRTVEGGTLYQTDASIQDGNYGGPLFDDHGEVVGVVVPGVQTNAGENLDINFAVPIGEALGALGITSSARSARSPGGPPRFRQGPSSPPAASSSAVGRSNQVSQRSSEASST